MKRPAIFLISAFILSFPFSNNCFNNIGAQVTNTPSINSHGTVSTGSATKQSIPAAPYYFEYHQPNGISFKARKFGDEFYHWMESEQGWSIGWNRVSKRYEYLDVGPDGKYKFTGLAVGIDDPSRHSIPKHLRESKEVIKGKRSAAKGPISSTSDKKTAPAVQTTGTLKNLVILANFSDTAISFASSDFDKLFNTIGYSENGMKGSVRDYYLEASYQNFTIQTTISQWVTLPNTKAYYGANDASGNDLRPREMIQDAITALDNAGFDFSPFDTDGDDWIDALTVIHQGQGEDGGGDPDCIWSHQWNIPTMTVDGINISRYSTDPELFGTGMTTIGVICHETGHVLGLRDLYDYGNDSEGIGNWGIMASGSWNDEGRRPGHFCSWSKAQLGWVIPTVLGSDQTAITVAPLSENAQAYKITSGMANGESLFVENRRLSGFDDYLPGEGLVVYHVDENQPDNDDQTHYKVAVLQADGLKNLENNVNRGDSGDPFPGSSNNRSLGPDTNPNTSSYTNGNTGIEITQISDPGNSMTFNLVVGGGGPTPTPGAPTPTPGVPTPTPVPPTPTPVGPTPTPGGPTPTPGTGGVLWDQPADYTYLGESQYFPDDTMGLFSADDFVNTVTWNIERIFVEGRMFDGYVHQLADAQNLTWEIYADAGGVPAGYPGNGTPQWSCITTPAGTGVTISGTGGQQSVLLDVVAAKGSAVTLDPGTYWLIFYPTLNYSGSDEWGWSTSGTQY